MTQITIREGHLGDLLELQQLFVYTISNVCQTDYDNKQIIAWIATIENYQRWQDILKNQFVLVAQDKESITGFCSLDNGNYIDLLYVHKDYQRQGIAHRLYDDIEKFNS
ncbi:MAG: GNAT family N-acetyltransferase [Flavitalea sp.]